jgi:hypothetical protein
VIKLNTPGTLPEKTLTTLKEKASVIAALFTFVVIAPIISLILLPHLLSLYKQSAKGPFCSHVIVLIPEDVEETIKKDV